MEQLLELVRPVVERAKRVILSPTEALLEVKTEEMTLASGIKEYLAILAAFPAIARFFGYTFVGPVRYPFFRMLFDSIVWYVVVLAIIVLMAKIIEVLAPSFGAMKDDMSAFKLAAYSYTPVLAAYVLYLIPNLSPLAILGSLYGIYILHLGLPIMMEAPKDKSMAYMVVTVIAGLILWIVLPVIAMWFVWGGSGGPGRPH